MTSTAAVPLFPCRESSLSGFPNRQADAGSGSASDNWDNYVPSFLLRLFLSEPALPPPPAECGELAEEILVKSNTDLMTSASNDDRKGSSHLPPPPSMIFKTHSSSSSSKLSQLQIEENLYGPARICSFCPAEAPCGP